MTAAAYINGRWMCYSTTDGRTRHYLGCRHLIPASAVAHVTPTYVSPTRSSAPDVEATPVPSPQSGPVPLASTSSVAGRSRSTVRHPGAASPPSTT